MKWIMTFVGGILLGALAMFIYLTQIGSSARPASVVQAPAAAAVPAPAQPAGAVIAPGTLPPAPVVTTDLSEADRRQFMQTLRYLNNYHFLNYKL